MEQHTPLCLTCKRCKVYQAHARTLNKTITCPYFNKVNGYPTAHQHTFIGEDVVQCSGYKERKK